MKTPIQSKLSQAYVKPVVVVAFLIGLCLAGISAPAAIISDNFAGHTIGALLNGTITPTGNATWAAVGCQFAGTGATSDYLVADAWASGFVGVTSVATDTVTLQLAIKANAGWASMKMGPTNAESPVTDGLGVTVTADGVCDVWINGSDMFRYTGDKYSYTATGFNLFKMEYNDNTNTLNMWANGVPLLVNDTVTLPGVIQYAGGFYGTSAASYDDFQVSVVPEPATLALLALGVLTLIRRGRRD